MPLKQKEASSGQTKETNASSLFMRVLSDRVIAFWNSSRVPWVACEDKYFLTMGTSVTSTGSPLPCEQALNSLFFSKPETNHMQGRVESGLANKYLGSWIEILGLNSFRNYFPELTLQQTGALRCRDFPTNEVHTNKNH